MVLRIQLGFCFLVTLTTHHIPYSLLLLAWQCSFLSIFPPKTLTHYVYFILRYGTWEIPEHSPSIWAIYWEVCQTYLFYQRPNPTKLIHSYIISSWEQTLLPLKGHTFLMLLQWKLNSSKMFSGDTDITVGGRLQKLLSTCSALWPLVLIPKLKRRGAALFKPWKRFCCSKVCGYFSQGWPRTHNPPISASWVPGS